MLLPFCTNAIGHLQQKPWPLLGQSPFPISPVAPAFQQPIPQIGIPAFRNLTGPCFPTLAPFHMINPQGIPRPVFTADQQATTVPPTPDIQSPKIGSIWSKASAPKSSAKSNDNSIMQKKIKIFRPWDDDREVNKGTSPSPATSSRSSSSSASTNGNLIKCDKPKKLEEPFGIQKVISRKVDSEKIARDMSQLDEVEQSKSAFEVFATNLGKSPDGHRCIYCGKMYSRKYGLKIHLRTHTGFKPLKCKVCQRPFGDPSNLNKHVRLHADVLMLPQSTQYKKLSDDHYDNGMDHPNASHSMQLSIFKCPFCGRSLVRKRDLERHLASRHPNEHVVDVERL